MMIVHKGVCHYEAVIRASHSQRAQDSLIQEYTLNQITDPYLI